MFKSLGAASAVGLLMWAGCGAPPGQSESPEGLSVAESALEAASNSHGVAETIHTTGVIDRTNPFFLTLGVNQRTCETCHAANQGWTLTARAAKDLFVSSAGLAPLFMLHDAGTRPDADISTLAARKAAFNPTVSKKGLIRFGRTIPATSEFTVTNVVDPYGFATPTQITAFRRPTPTVNEAKTSSTTWTGGTGTVPTQLVNTAGGAARLHEQRVDAVPADQTAAMRDFQLGLFFAQTVDLDAGALDADGALGGPTNLMAQPFYLGINDIQGLDPAGTPFSRKVFNLFDAWAPTVHQHHDHDGCDNDDDETFSGDVHNHKTVARAAIYRGQEIFNNREFDIRGVHGINDLLGQETVRGTCSTCHNAPNVGGHSVFRMFDVGTADPPSCTPDLPLLTLQNKTTGATRTVCDMGRGGNGVWADVGAFRAPPLRGLAARAPYFHDGQAATIKQVVKYFNNRFGIGLNKHERRDLEAFLGAL